MPEGVELLQMKAQFIKGNLVGRTISSVEHPERYQKNGDAYTTIGRPRLGDLGGCKVVDMRVRHKQLVLEVEHANEEKEIICWQLALGSIFTVVPEEELQKYPFIPHETNPPRSRLNTLFRFTDCNDAWALVDCLQYINFPSWTRHRPAENFKWRTRVPCFLTESEEWWSYLKKEKKFRRDFPVTTINKLLMNVEIFPGIGEYMRNEILARLWRHAKLPPWHIVSSSHRNLPVELQMIQHCALDLLEQSTFFWKFFSLTKHQPRILKSYLLQHLLAYRKDRAKCFSVKGAERNKEKCKVYTFADGQPSDDIKEDEGWEITTGSSLQLSSLGVGPLWWYSAADIPLMETVEVSVPAVNQPVRTTESSSEKPRKRKRRPNRVARNKRSKHKKLAEIINNRGSHGNELLCPKQRKKRKE